MPDESMSAMESEADSLSTAEGVASAASDVEANMGGVDPLVNVVGSSASPSGGFAVLDDERWQRELSQNLFVAVRFDRTLVPGMSEGGNGAAIHVSSIQRTIPLYEATLAYAAAMAALTTYSTGLSKVVGPKRVRVNIVSPFIETSAATRFIERLTAQQNADADGARQGLMRSSLGTQHVRGFGVS